MPLKPVVEAEMAGKVMTKSETKALIDALKNVLKQRLNLRLPVNLYQRCASSGNN